MKRSLGCVICLLGVLSVFAQQPPPVIPPPAPAPAQAAPAGQVAPLPAPADADKRPQQLTRIGYDAFGIDPSKITPGQVDKTYIPSPNDKLVLKVWGQLQLTHNLTISDNLYLEIPDVPGRIYVSGLTMGEIEERVRQHMATVYASYFNLENPAASTAFIDLALAEVRDLRFLVLGEVRNPGSYALHPSRSNMLYALAVAGGVKDSGSLRAIKIRRGEEVLEFDFYQLFLMGQQDFKRWQIRNNDIIYVPQKGPEITITGEIKRPGIFELKNSNSEDLEAFLNLVGGFKPTANSQKLLIRRMEMNVGARTLDINLEEIRRQGKKVFLQDQDQIVVFAIDATRRDYVSLRGNGITMAGEYQMHQGYRVADLVREAGGVRPDAYLGRADLVRTRPDKTKTYRQIDLKKALEEAADHNVMLQPLDELIIYSVQDIEGGQDFITLRGHVKTPGRVEYYAGMRLYDLLFSRGGFQDVDYLRDTYLERADLVRSVAGGGVSRELLKFNLGKLLDGDATQNLELKSDDEVVIYSQREIIGGDRFVTLSGYVKTPGQHKIYQGMRLFDLLYTAGGYQDPDFRRQAFLSRGDLLRPVSRGNRVEKEITRFDLGALLGGDQKHNLELQSGDEIKLYAAAEFQEKAYVTIEGLVTKPGRYELASNMDLCDLLVQAGGLTESASQTHAEVGRIQMDGNSEVKQETIRVEIPANYLKSDSSRVFQLQRDDIVFVRRKPGALLHQVVDIQGEVVYPGKYPLTTEKNRIADVLALAGGPRPETAFLPGAMITRAGVGRVMLNFEKALAEPQSPDNLVLIQGDTIVIPVRPNVVKVEGEVYFPVAVPFREGQDVDYYIKQAGGANKAADTSRIQVLHPDGRVTLSKGFLFFSKIKVLPGSTITVPSRFGKLPTAMPAAAAPQPAAPAPAVVPPVKTP